MPVDRRSRRRRLFELAIQQGGYVTAAQAKHLGYSYQAQAHHIGVGNWHRVGRGLFRLDGWPVDTHDDLIRLSLWAGGEAVVSHESALAVHGIGEFESARVHLTVPLRFSRRNDAVVLHRAELPDSDVAEGTGFRLTTVARSLIDQAMSGADEEQLARAISEAFDRGLVSRRQLRSRAEAVVLGDMSIFDGAMARIGQP